MKRHLLLRLNSLAPPELVTQDGQFKIPHSCARELDGNRVSLPNASLCADFLLNSSRHVVGVCVGVAGDDLPLVRALFGRAEKSRVSIRESGVSRPDCYAQYPEWNLLEVIWQEAYQAVLVEAQSNQVLWYTKAGHPNVIAAMVLEDLDFIEDEVEGKFTLSPPTSDLARSTPRG
jgi:hypothetical protein